MCFSSAHVRTYDACIYGCVIPLDWLLRCYRYLKNVAAGETGFYIDVEIMKKGKGNVWRLWLAMSGQQAHFLTGAW